MSASMWSIGNSHTAMGVKNGNLGKLRAVTTKAEHIPILSSIISIPRYIPNRNAYIYSSKDMHKNVHKVAMFIIVPNQKLPNAYQNKYIVEQSHNGILYRKEN